MKSLCLLFLLVVVAGCSTSEWPVEYTQDELISAPWLKVQVAPTFDAPEEYQVNRHEPHMLIHTQYSGQGGYNWGKKQKITRVSLTVEQHEKIKSLADSALTEFPLKDEVLGFDGTTWVLESSIYNYSKLVAWSPEYATKERGYGSLFMLREYLDEIIEAHQALNK